MDKLTTAVISAIIILSLSVMGCIREINMLEHGKRWERVLVDENQFRRLSAKKMGCTQREIEKQLPDLTLDQVYDRMPYYDGKFLLAAQSFREMLLVLPCRRN